MTTRALLSLSLSVVAFFATLLVPSTPAAALEIYYETEEDIAPPGGGISLWIYTYTLAEASFQEGEGFSVLFHPEEFEGIFALGSSPDWDVIAIPPDPLLPDFGLLDALALVDDPDTSFVFRVGVAFTGEGAPAEQPWIRYGTDFATLESGTTLPLGVPEPSVALLLLSSGALLVSRRPTWGRRPSPPENRNAV